MLYPTASRLLTLAGAVLCDWILVDHQADGVETFDFEYSSDKSKLAFHAFVRWDSVHMLKIAAEGYRNENQLVFFPLYPTIMQYLASIFPIVGLTKHEELLCAGLVLNLIGFVSASHVLKTLLRTVFPAISCKTLNLAVWMFCLNPAGVFFSVPYTESLFALLSWTGFLLFARGNDFLSTIPLCLASFLRSNGSLNIIVVGLTWLGRPTPTPTAAQAQAVSVWSDVGIALVASAILMPAVLLNQIHLHILCSESLVCATCLCPVDVSNLLPTLSNWFLHSGGATSSPLLRISTDAHTIDLCNQHSAHYLPPVVYSYLQSKYWNVGFLRQYHWRQIPNFVIAIPIWCVVVYTLYNAHKVFGSSCKTSSNDAVSKVQCSDSSDTDTRVSETAARKRKRGKKSKHKHNNSETVRIVYAQPCASAYAYIHNTYTQWVARPETPYTAHLLVLLVISMFFAHVQMSTRLFCAASPVVYLGLAHMAGRADWKCNVNLLVCRYRVSWVHVYIVVYNLLGVVLHSNYYPWT